MKIDFHSWPCRLLALPIVLLATLSTAGAAGTTQLRISWSGVAEPISGYRVYLLAPGAADTSSHFTETTEILLDAGQPPASGDYESCVSVIDDLGLEGPCSDVGTTTFQ